jgi:hypothetical protein
VKRQSIAWREGPSAASVENCPVAILSAQAEASPESIVTQTSANDLAVSSIRWTFDAGKSGEVVPVAAQQS